MLSLECIVVVLLCLFIPSTGNAQEPRNVSLQLKNNGGRAFIATIAKPNRLSKAFMGMPGTEKKSGERVEYSELLKASGFPNVAAIVEERADDPVSWRELLKEFDRRNREGRFLPFKCNVVPDPPTEFDGLNTPTAVSSSSRQLDGKTVMGGQEPSKAGIPDLESLIEAGVFDCGTLAEWSYQVLECDKVHDCQVTDSRRELAFRLMAELGSSNGSPIEVWGRPSVFLYLAQFSINRGDRITADHFFNLSWEAASAGNTLGHYERDEFFRVLESLREKLERSSVN